MIEAKVNAKPLAAAPARKAAGGDVVDLLAVLQESIRKNTEIKPSKTAAKRGRGASTSTLVKQKRRAA
jgi:non-homologous end joining protein Ku